MVVVLPYLFAIKLVEYQGELVCMIQWKETFANYFLAIYVVFLYIPVALLTVLYSIILINLKSQKIPGERTVSVEEQRTKRNRHVRKMALAIVLGFVVCWAPWSIVNLLILFACDRRLPCGIIIFWSITDFRADLNCAINPCICFIFSGNYRQGLKRVQACLHAVQE